MTVSSIPLERWQEAQAGELAFWQSADRTELARYLDGLYMERLGITPDAVRGLTITDIGGGPYPLALLMGLPVSRVIVVDPLPIGEPAASVIRIAVAAEDYVGPKTVEVWGYNVLQHVRDPVAVLATAKAHAVARVRWFDWTDSPIASHHPHSITGEWLVSQFPTAEWQFTILKRGSVRVPKVQHYIALVAERAETVSQ